MIEYIPMLLSTAYYILVDLFGDVNVIECIVGEGFVAVNAEFLGDGDLFEVGHGRSGVDEVLTGENHDADARRPEVGAVVVIAALFEPSAKELFIELGVVGEEEHLVVAVELVDEGVEDVGEFGVR